MSNIYPANLLTTCFTTYDPSMNRLDPWLDVMQQKRNAKQIKHAVSVNALICDVLSLSLASLDDRRRDILLLRYRDGKTLRECGEKYNISAERARQLSTTAINHIKRYAKGPFLALIWPDTAMIPSDEWVKWVVKHSKTKDDRAIPYASIPTESKRLLITKVSLQSRKVYDNAVKE